ncbi:peptidoglycan-binding domain-containing protein [Streptomyces xiamenensis]
MSQDADCLICGRPAEPSGEPACGCLTHSLSRPVPSSVTGPDPADVALFSVESPPQQRRAMPRVPLQATPEARAQGAHRKPRQRTRAAAAAGGAMAAAVVGCTALAASLMGGQGRTNEALEKSQDGPMISLPDGDPLPDGGTLPDGGDRWDYGPPAPPPSPSPGAGTEADTGNGTDTGPDADDGTVPVPPPPPPPVTETGEPSPPAEPAPPPAPEDPDEPPEETLPSEPLPSPDPPGGVLREGDTGEQVVELQQRLRQLGWVYDGPAHGTYDERTADAVARFQMAYGVQGDEWGVYGVNTRQSLEQHTAL